MAVHLDANRFLQSDRARLMSSFLQHGSETEEFSLRRFIDHHFLLVLVDGRHPHHARDHDVGPATRFAHLVDSLPGGKLLDLNLAGQNRGFFVVEQGKERNVSQNFWIARHRMSPGTESSQSALLRIA